MLGLSTALSFLSGGGTPITGGAVTVPDEPYVPPEPVDPPADPPPDPPSEPPSDPGDTGDTGGGDPTPPPPPPPPATAPALPLAVTTRWHPAFSTVTLDAGRVATASDLEGVADTTAPTGEGPKAMTDALGRPFWRFEGDSYLSVADTVALSSRAMSVFMVGRFHQVSTRSPVFSIGSVAAGTASNTIHAGLETSTYQNSVPLVRAFSHPRNASYPTPEKMVTGSQMQVVGMAGRPVEDGATTLWMNSDKVTATQPYPRTDIAGAEIGRYAYSPGASGTWGRFDLYEMIVVDTAVSDADGDTLVSDLMATYGIVPITNQMVLEGDSIMQGTGDVTTGLRADMVLTDPGAGLIGPDWRVVNMASSGAQVTKLLERRNTDAGWPVIKAPGQNVVALEIGRNDLSPAGGKTPAQHYSNVVTYLTDGFGASGQNIFARDWQVRKMVNIGASVSLEPNIDPYRDLIKDPSFATDTQTAAGDAYAGQLQLVHSNQITLAGDTIFADKDDALDTTYYAGDSTHPNIAGCALRVTGGDTPENGIAYGL